MRAARLALLAVALLAAVLVTSASARETGAPAAPKALRGFELRPNESETHTFSRTPAFAWNPVRGAACYEFELATSRSFDGSSVIWSNVTTGPSSGESCRGSGAKSIRIPATSMNLVLPWFTGKPYALYAHVRAITTHGATSWSSPYGFNMRWEELPVPMASRPGLVRWTPVGGATAYDVWYVDIDKQLRTHTNVADERDLYTFHLEDAWWRTVRWRVRAVRLVVGTIPNGLPAVSYGPWSPVFATTNPGWSSGPLKLGSAVSDQISSPTTAGPHELMPGLTFTGDQVGGTSYRLFRLYVFTDRDCVNVVFKSSVVGGPAFAPRISGPLKLPTSQDELDTALSGVLGNGKDENAKTYAVDASPITSNEAIGDNPNLLHVDLPDLDAQTTRYFWTVVPVGIHVDDAGAFTYWDAELPQDACQNGSMAMFGKESEPAVTTGGSPYVSGLSPKGRLLAQAGRKPVVYSTPLIAWKPVVGATGYQIQWSRTKYPWRASGTSTTAATSSVLQLGPGLWYYRVRGLNVAQVGTPAMTWSAPVALKIVRPTFQIARR